MSYYSELAISMDREDYIYMVDKAISECASAYDLITRQCDIFINTHNNGICIVSIYYNSIRWSNNSEDVRWVEDYLNYRIKHGANMVSVVEDNGNIEEMYYFGNDEAYSDYDFNIADNAYVPRGIIIQGSIVKFEKEFGSKPLHNKSTEINSLI